MKYCILYPGQGSQIAGMGKELYNTFQVARDVFDELNTILQHNISNTIFHGRQDQLSKTQVVQPAIFATCIAISKVLEYQLNTNLIDFAAYFLGHSLGQYISLYMAQCFSFATGVKIISQRAKAMQASCSKKNGSMLACFNVSDKMLENILNECGKIGFICVANYNSKSQIVLSGQDKAIQLAKNILTINKKKCVQLKVSGAFHTKMMQDAEADFANKIKDVHFNKLKCTVISNQTARPITSTPTLNEVLTQHITHCVMWQQSIEYCLQHAQNNNYQISFVEIGPKPTLTNMLKRDYENVQTHFISNISDLEQFVTYTTKT